MCKYSYLKTCKFSCLCTCIYLYLAQMYEMYLKNQLQMTTFLLRIMPFTGFVPVWMFLMSRGCEAPQASPPSGGAVLILPNRLNFSTFVSVTAACPLQICGFRGGRQIFLYFSYRSSSAIFRPNSSSMELWMLAHTLAEKRRPQSISVSHCRGDNVGRSAQRMPWRMRP